ncbi:nuclear transport factor 2-like isoform X2 [Rutidosis leptorrhynchoides]|uniref:nuclear transport factor 2-like isoform X2 n=1 Tax=Rutidosis leptorrhynchoides TaxID=125765 RepID=UPI003A995D1F
MASPYSSSVTASQVGSYFVQQYYQVLQQQPEFAHQFYTDSSTMVRVDGESTVKASAVFEIHTLIQSLQFTGIEIKTLNSLESWGEGITVVLSGSVKSKCFSGRRKFFQTFFLAPQEKGYFVMNDIFHFVGDDVINHHLGLVAARHKNDFQPLNSTSPMLLVGEDALEIQVRENIKSLDLEGENEGNYYNTSEQHHYQQQQEDEYSEDYEEEQPVNEPSYNNVDHVQEPSHQNTVQEYVQEQPLQYNTVEYVQEPIQSVQVPASEPMKFTYASILQAKGKSVPSVPATVIKSVPSTTTRSWDQPPEPVSSYVPETTYQVPEEALVNEEGESKSVYVRNLPTTATTLDILEEFKNFGRIKEDGVFLKNRKDIAICFAFVEFEDVSGVQKAIQASPIQLAGRQVYVEERRANSSSSSSRGGRGRGTGRGRGSYDSSRGGRYGGVSNGRGNGYRDY